MSSNLVVIAFEGRHTAEGVLEGITKLQEEGELVLEDAVIASRGPGVNVKITQTVSQTGSYAGKGAGIGLIAGLLLGGPIGGLVGGAAVGAITGKLKDHGIEDKFVEQVSDGLRPDSSALFLLVGEANAEKALEALKPYKGRVLKTTLSVEQEQLLKKTLS